MQDRSMVFQRFRGLSSQFGRELPAGSVGILGARLDLARSFVFPGFCDVHVHLREPGFSYKETIASGTRAAARGGYTDVCSMPNLNPVPDCLENLEQELSIIRRDAVIGVHPYGAITKGERGEALSDMEAMAPYVVGFSDDGKGVQSREQMRLAMERAKALGKPLVAHCEDNALLRGGYIHDGPYAAAHNHPGICAESEWGPIARDLELAAQTGCAYHVCHVSTRQSVELIRQAKKSGVDVTCETAPHYLTLCQDDLEEDGRFKMNPPLRDRADREALVEGLRDGTVDIIATDHAPHSAEEKSGGLKGSLMGVVGLETAFPVLFTRLVLPGLVPLERVLDALTAAPRRRFGLETQGDYCVWDLDSSYEIDPKQFASLGRSTPFAGWKVYGKCLATIQGGKIVWLN